MPVILQARGLDTSRWQNREGNWVGIDWEKAKSRGVSFGVTRATVATYYTDPTLLANIQGMISAGVVWGCYHVVHPGYSAELQIARLFDALGDLRPQLPIVLDVERRGFEPEETNRCVMGCIEEVKDIDGRVPIFYGGPDFIKTQMGSELERSYLRECDLWIANYEVDEPEVPAPWTGWVFWQKSNNGDGEYYGAESRAIDLDLYWKSFDDMVSRYGIEISNNNSNGSEDPEENDMDVDEIKEVYAGIFDVWKEKFGDVTPPNIPDIVGVVGTQVVPDPDPDPDPGNGGSGNGGEDPPQKNLLVTSIEKTNVRYVTGTNAAGVPIIGLEKPPHLQFLHGEQFWVSPDKVRGDGGDYFYVVAYIAPALTNARPKLKNAIGNYVRPEDVRV